MKKKKNEDLDFLDFTKLISKSSKLRYLNYFNLQLKQDNSNKTNKTLSIYNSNINETAFNHFKNFEVEESEVIDLLFRIERENSGQYLRKSARNIDKNDNQTFKMLSDNKNSKG